MVAPGHARFGEHESPVRLSLETADEPKIGSSFTTKSTKIHEGVVKQNETVHTALLFDPMLLHPLGE